MHQHTQKTHPKLSLSLSLSRLLSQLLTPCVILNSALTPMLQQSSTKLSLSFTIDLQSASACGSSCFYFSMLPLRVFTLRLRVQEWCERDPSELIFRVVVVDVGVKHLRPISHWERSRPQNAHQFDCSGGDGVLHPHMLPRVRPSQVARSAHAPVRPLPHT